MFASETFLSKKLLNDIKMELGAKNYKQEYLIYNANMSNISDIYQYKKLIRSDKKARFEMLDRLALLQKQTNSAILASIVIKESLWNINITDETLFTKYMKTSVELLYHKKMCDGYIFMGEYLDRFKHDKKEAMKIYSQGMKECKIPWKNTALLSRYRKVKYQTREK